MTHWKRIAVVMLGLSGLAWAAELPQSLRGATPVSDSASPPPMAQYPAKGAALPRTLEHQPPLIPHKASYPITLERNGCTGCHDPQRAAKMKATPTDPSHLDGQGKLKNEYYFCKQCHVPQQSVAQTSH
ncbi:nitrate reductase cytochrome c-type subunit [Ferrimonas balearica]|uniref:nitrate reductase cytochrome c-type subunit n=1 Tax=Ferrimonas balearica TaxID=44012 RepID=UPI001C9A0665|nr:nitrate reductase cytochrome c-type subunit [Ferrimonas balearica]MBY5922660.1 nitrate reductase cytochrome c-type subunit [Ferrimonas balearica]MBY5995644.1 nitrate reductase cytochrome c-type subunit [Ferrimonas balearica]